MTKGMTRVAYNACYGGFSLSREAVLLARKLSNNPKWGGACIKGDIYEDTNEICSDDYGHIDNSIKRTNHVLIKVIKQLGKKANGYYANLAIAEIPVSSKYRIDEFAGSESVRTPEDYNWEIA